MLASVSGGLVTLEAGEAKRLCEAAWVLMPCARRPPAVMYAAAVDAALRALAPVKDSALRGVDAAFGCGLDAVGPVKEL